MGLSLSADLALREGIMERLAHLRDQAGGTVSREQLTDFVVDGERRRLVDASGGIWNPRDLNTTLSIVSSPAGPYDDRQVDEGCFVYAYRIGSTDGVNRKLRAAIEFGMPLIFLHKQKANLFVPALSVSFADDRPPIPERSRGISALHRAPAEPLRTSQAVGKPGKPYAPPPAVFRASVIRAYETRCTVCHLQHGEHSTPPTSCPTPTKQTFRTSATVSASARSITLRTTRISWASHRIA